MKIKLIEINSKACEFYSAYCEKSESCEGICRIDYIVEIDGNKLNNENRLIETAWTCIYYQKNLTEIIRDQILDNLKYKGQF